MQALANAATAPVTSAMDAIAAPAASEEGLPSPPSNPARTVQAVAGAALSLINMGSELTNMGFALATAAVPSVPLPAATLGTLYVGPPHGHAHPPSLVPPSPVPIPLPSLGPVTIGTSIKVLIGGMPAARCGDIAMAVTCCGIMPGAAIFTGSSKVFIAGTRAARVTDITNACMKDAGGPVRGFAAAMMAAGQAAGLAGVVADAVDAGSASDPALAAAQGMAAAMGAAQLAADAVALAMSAAIGSDPAVPPAPGMLATPLAPHVQIGGFPMINIPDPAHWLFKRVKGRLAARKQKRQQSDEDSAASCPHCPR
jgi:uncharacterized Zn-binding protein involved in type VI secretion